MIGGITDVCYDSADASMNDTLHTHTYHTLLLLMNNLLYMQSVMRRRTFVGNWCYISKISLDLISMFQTLSCHACAARMYFKELHIHFVAPPPYFTYSTACCRDSCGHGD